GGPDHDAASGSSAASAIGEASRPKSARKVMVDRRNLMAFIPHRSKEGDTDVKSVVEPDPRYGEPMMVPDPVPFEQHTLDSLRHLYRSLKRNGDKAMEQVSLEDMLWMPTEDANNIAIIIRHLHGNMMSRWTDFLFSDGEKPWRERDREFEQPHVASKAELMELWETGWMCTLAAIDG